jgi:hypothetical protein
MSTVTSHRKCVVKHWEKLGAVLVRDVQLQVRLSYHVLSYFITMRPGFVGKSHSKMATSEELIILFHTLFHSNLLFHSQLYHIPISIPSISFSSPSHPILFFSAIPITTNILYHTLSF